jgi:hypothetical protein
MVEQGHPDHGGGQADKDPLSPLVKAYIDKQVENATKQHDESQAKGKKWRNSWRSASPVTKGSFIMTTAIAVATIAYALIAWGQYRAMKKIATDNSQQTQELINAANQMKNASWTFSGAAQGINIAVWNAVTQLGIQADASKTQAEASKTLAGVTAKQWTANRELIESQRASISVSFGKVLNPITFHDGSPSIVFSILVQNAGAIKATHIIIRTKPYYSLVGNNIFTEPLQKQRDYCAADVPPSQEWSWDASGKRIDLKGLRDWTFTVEPRSTVERQINFSMAKPGDGEIIKWPPSDMAQQNPNILVTDRVYPIVVGCVDYQSGAMPEKHQAGFIFEVQEAFSDPAVPNAAPTLIHYGIDVQRERVVVTQFFFGQGKQY